MLRQEGLTSGLEEGKTFCCAKIMLAAWSCMAFTTAGWLCPVEVTPNACTNVR